METDLIFGCVSQRWSPQIGDPSLLGWMTVAAYGVAAVLSVLASFSRPRDRRFWLILALLLAGLCVNKQLDLQSALTATGRCIAQAGDWYDSRRIVQFAFVAALLIAGLAGLLVATVRLRRALPRIGLALVGTALLLVFVAVRAVGFHHVDALINSRLGPARMNWILELSGIVLISLNGAWSAFVGARARSIR